MKLSTNTLLILLGILAFGIMACFPITMLAMPLFEATPPAPVDSLVTVQAIVTQTVSAMTQNAPTPTSTVTPAPPTHTSVPPTNSPPPTPTQVTYCNWLTFVGDVTVPDGTKFAPGDTFTKVWRLKNRGTCTWTTDHMLVLTGGEPMGGTNAVRLPHNVAPGQSVDVSVTLTAPSKRGHYVGYWMLRSPSGALFGFGPNANQAFYVDIRTENPPQGEVSGNICYPSEFNPPLTLYFELKGTNQVVQVSIPDNTPTYRVLLPAGRYYAYAWAPGYNLEGAYVHPNRLMKSFVVRNGEATAGINICDWDVAPHGRGD